MTQQRIIGKYERTYTDADGNIHVWFFDEEKNKTNCYKVEHRYGKIFEDYLKQKKVRKKRI